MCNNLKQLSGAAHYENTFGSFPAVYGGAFTVGWGWGSLILPSSNNRTYTNSSRSGATFGNGNNRPPPPRSVRPRCRYSSAP